MKHFSLILSTYSFNLFFQPFLHPPENKSPSISKINKKDTAGALPKLRSEIAKHADKNGFAPVSVYADLLAPEGSGINRDLLVTCCLKPQSINNELKMSVFFQNFRPSISKSKVALLEKAGVLSEGCDW